MKKQYLIWSIFRSLDFWKNREDRRKHSITPFKESFLQERINIKSVGFCPILPIPTKTPLLSPISSPSYSMFNNTSNDYQAFQPMNLCFDQPRQSESSVHGFNNWLNTGFENVLPQFTRSDPSYHSYPKLFYPHLTENSMESHDIIWLIAVHKSLQGNLCAAGAPRENSIRSQRFLFKTKTKFNRKIMFDLEIWGVKKFEVRREIWSRLKF